MKVLFLSIAFIIGFHDLSIARNVTMADMEICREVAVSLAVQFVEVDKDPPRSWGDFAGVRMVRDGLLKPNIFRMEAMNSFAIVPDAPAIRDEPGISPKYVKQRLFLISREVAVNKSEVRGRFVILIASEKEGSRPTRVDAHFISEIEATKILNQIKDFDPEKQPLAFEDVERFKREERLRRDKAIQEIEEHLKKKVGQKAGYSDDARIDNEGKGVERPNSVKYSNEKSSESLTPRVYLLCFLVVGVLLVCIVFYCRRSR